MPVFWRFAVELPHPLPFASVELDFTVAPEGARLVLRVLLVLALSL